MTVSTPNVPLANALDEVLGNRDTGGVTSTVRVAIDDIVQQLMGSSAFDALRTDVATALTQSAGALTQAENAVAGQVAPLTEVAAAQTTVLSANTYANGADGVGATITGNANGALATSYFDGIAALSGSPRVFVRLEGAKNGIYVVTQVGDGSHPFILTRAGDADTATELGLCNFLVIGGSTLIGRRYQCQQKVGDITVGSTSLTFASINDDGTIAGEVVAGRGSYTSIGGRFGAVDALSSELLGAVSLLTVVQTIGRTVTPATGTAMSNNTFAYGDPVTRASYLKRIRVFALTPGPLIVKRMTRTGITNARVGDDHSFALVDGANLITLVGDDRIRFDVGEIVGFYGSGVVAVNGSTPGDGVGYYASGTGNVLSFDDASLTTSVRLEIGFDFEEVIVSNDRISTMETRLAEATMAMGSPAMFSQSIGQATPVSGVIGTNNTWALAVPVVRDSYLVRTRAWGYADGTAIIRRMEEDSDLFARNGIDYLLAIASGDNEFAMEEPIFFPAGSYVGLHCYGVIATAASPGSSGLYSAAANVAEFTDSTITTSARLEVGFDFYAKEPFLPAFTKLVATCDWNHALGYGQSNDLGSANAAVVNSSPSSYHKTFNVGPKMTKPGLAGNNHDGSIKALVEDDVSPTTGSSGSTYGETKCSSFARHFSRLASRNGNAPTWFASVAGKGGTALSGIGIGTTWIKNLEYHVRAAKAAADTAGKSYGVSTVLFDHGESDQDAQTTKDAYLSGMHDMIDWFWARVKKITGQQHRPVWLFTVSPYHLAESSGATDAILELCASRGDCHLVVPGYIFAHVADDTHLTAVAQALKGHYYARAAEQLWRGEVPDAVRWLGAYAAGTTLTIRAEAPTALAINTSIVSAVTDYGFAVSDDTGSLSLSGIAVGSAVLNPKTRRYETPITMTLNRALDANPAISYAKVYASSSPDIQNGAGGNIFDSTTDTVTISGTPYSLAHAAPPVTLPVFVEE